MPNGSHGDDPLTDMLYHHEHPFPPRVEALLRKIISRHPEFDTMVLPVDKWMDSAMEENATAALEEILERWPKEGKEFAHELILRFDVSPEAKESHKQMLRDIKDPESSGIVKDKEPSGCIAFLFGR